MPARFALLRAARSPELRRHLLAYFAFGLATYSTWLAVFVFAQQRGGAKEVGIVALVLLLPGAVLAPFAAYAGDRYPPQRAMAVGYAVQVVAYGATAMAAWAGSALAVYAAATLFSTAVTFCRPLMVSMLPAITHSPREFVAANALTGLVDQTALLMGPLLAGVVMVLASPAEVFALAMLGTLFATVMAALTPADALPRPAIDAREVVRQACGGFVALRRSPHVAVLVFFTACVALVAGTTDVLFVTFSDLRLGGGGGQSSILNAASGFGAVLAATVAAKVLRSPRASVPILWAAVAMATAFAGLAFARSIGVATALFVLEGMGEGLLGLAAVIALQRRAPMDVMSRVFGIAESVHAGALATGSILVAVLIDVMSLSSALTVMGGTVLVLVLSGVLVLRHLGEEQVEAPADVVDRLLVDPVFAPLPAPVIERLARDAVAVAAPAGVPVIRQGDLGDRYYLVVDGELDVRIDGQLRGTLTAGQSFGEIALLRDIPRTATVVPTTNAQLLAIDRDDFLAAVTGHPRSLGEVHAVVHGHLATAA
ncbi:MAG: hypothetical protein RL238_824 [Actinomycetota bacterium]|jgi:MFS family permease